MSNQLAQIERECLRYLGDDFIVADAINMVRELIERDKRSSAAVAAEREACAKVAESAHMIHGMRGGEIAYSRETAHDIAAAIRARSNGAGRE